MLCGLVNELFMLLQQVIFVDIEFEIVQCDFVKIFDVLKDIELLLVDYQNMMFCDDDWQCFVVFCGVYDYYVLLLNEVVQKGCVLYEEVVVVYVKVLFVWIEVVCNVNVLVQENCKFVE